MLEERAGTPEDEKKGNTGILGTLKAYRQAPPPYTAQGISNGVRNKVPTPYLVIKVPVCLQ